MAWSRHLTRLRTEPLVATAVPLWQTLAVAAMVGVFETGVWVPTPSL